MSDVITQARQLLDRDEVMWLRGEAYRTFEEADVTGFDVLGALGYVMYRDAATFMERSELTSEEREVFDAVARGMADVEDHSFGLGGCRWMPMSQWIETDTSLVDLVYRWNDVTIDYADVHQALVEAAIRFDRKKKSLAEAKEDDDGTAGRVREG